MCCLPTFGLSEELVKKNLVIAFWFTLVTTVMFGILYPLAVTGLAQVLFPKRANGQRIENHRANVYGAWVFSFTAVQCGLWIRRDGEQWLQPGADKQDADRPSEDRRTKSPSGKSVHACSC